jgi:hypothetical protein
MRPTLVVAGGCATTNGWHTLPEHVPPRQLCPHDPQFFGSLVRSAHLPLQFWSPLGQPHMPLWQVAPIGEVHGVLHPPQLLLSVCVFTHVVPH